MISFLCDYGEPERLVVTLALHWLTRKATGLC